ncbi:MAG TPA: YbhB/YbcL family Raf kinase inhibitor-like protein [Bacteroidota bacterium]|nr:YbhB/YbcL family Raf kinase inhibitor-like protein [Bacteroidota bacterium]
MKVFCPALLSGKYIPNKFAHRGVPGGQNVSLPIHWGDIPPGTKSFVFSVTDTHASSLNWVHWFVINVPHWVREIPERASGQRDRMPPGALELRNSFGELGYNGPSPPKNSGPHSYRIAVHALNVETLRVGPFSAVEECRAEIRLSSIASAETVGIFQR